MKKLRLENGAKECIVQISARAFQRVLLSKIGVDTAENEPLEVWGKIFNIIQEAQEAAAATAKAAKVAQAAAAAQLKVPSKVRKGLDIRGDVYTDAGVKKVWCLKCKKGINYSGWSTHCSEHHPVQSSDVDKLGKVDDDDDDGVRKDDDTGQLKCSDAGLLCAGISDAVSTQKEAKAAAPGRRQKASSGDKGAQKAKKARVAPKGK